MRSIRISEIAKEKNISSDKIIEACINLGIDVKNHASSITPEQKEAVLKILERDKKSVSLKGVKKISKKIIERVKEANKRVIAKKATGIKSKSKAKSPSRVEVKKTTKKETKSKDKKLKSAGKVEVIIEAVPEKEKDIEGFIGLEEEKVIKKSSDFKNKPFWDEEKKINIRKVLDKELDKEEKEGKLRNKSRILEKKRTADSIKLIDHQAGIISKTKEGAVSEKIVKRPEIKKIIELPEGGSIKQLSEKIGIPSNEMIQALFNIGEIVSINQPLEKDWVEFLAHEYNFKYSIIDFEDKLNQIFKDFDKDLVIRPPIVTVMGHVDHGKTTLLDTIRQSNVASGEAGGITQKIGAYQTIYNNRKITFIDTPGHEAFTSMRARGARVTDIAVIVIAADDGIMPQTVEAINHAKEAGVPIMVAVNKIDLPNSNPEKIKQGLTEYNLVPENWGGDTVFVEISAKNKINIDELLEMILLVADLHEIKGNPNSEGSGIIIESRLDKGFGPVGTVLVKRGSIKVGDFFVTGNSYGRVRSIKDEYGNLINKGELSQPIEVSGFSSVPQGGDRFYVVKNEKMAKEIISKREYQKKLTKIAEVKKHITLEDLAEISKENEIKKLKIVLKSESNGSLDAVEKSLRDIEEENIKLEIIHKAVGAITDSDILLASASNAIVIGFGIIATSKAKSLSKEENVEVRTYDIIYKLIDDIKLAFKGMLEPKMEERLKGTVEVREIFKMPKIGNVAGCYITDGEVERSNQVRVIRDGKIIYNGKILSLHRFKEDVKKVAAGYECGVRVENYQDLNKGDVLEIYEQKEVQ
jgi:translation initiation factor IF-2